ncbi:hypothetical protein CPC08DRAFT_775590 [Agrocybe pediades]|nr:hypothetical protein CPC08DRAFT_775590 [Agrocybe pediades]
MVKTKMRTVMRMMRMRMRMRRVELKHIEGMYGSLGERLRDDEFLGFVKRSAGRLEYLQVRGVGWDYDFLASVLREAPSITHLGVHSRCTIGNESIANSLLDHLACTVIQPEEEELDLALLLAPRLRHLTFYSERSSSPKISWNLVSKCFGHASNHQPALAACRRLKSVVVQCHGDQYQRNDPYIDKDSLLRLIELRKAGAKIAYWFTGHESDCSSDFFVASMKFHGLNEETRGEEATVVITQ